MAVSIKKQIAKNKRNTVFIMVIFIAFITLIGGLFAWIMDDLSILYYVFGISVVYALVQYFLSDKLAIISAGARQIDRSDNQRYYKIVESLASEAKVSMPKVYIVNDSAPNAFATGRDPQHACVAATTGLLEIMDDRELKAVMAHEMSHVRNYDIRLSMITYGLTMVIGLISDLGLRMLFYSNSDRDEEEKSPIGLILALITILLSPIIATIIQLAVSRQREYLADASAANLVGNSGDMISALRKLDSQSRPMHQQNVASESMYIANPLKKGLLSSLFSTHPSITSRIERLESSK